MSGEVHGPTHPLMTSAEANKLLDQVVYDRVRELIDFCSMLDFEQELWRALHECGLARAEVPGVSAQLIARALARIGEDHVKLANEPYRLGTPS
jgi:hypothetical protein